MTTVVVLNAFVTNAGREGESGVSPAGKQQTNEEDDLWPGRISCEVTLRFARLRG